MLHLDQASVRVEIKGSSYFLLENVLSDNPCCSAGLFRCIITRSKHAATTCYSFSWPENSMHNFVPRVSSLVQPIIIVISRLISFSAKKGSVCCVNA